VSPVRAFILAARPATLTAAVTPVVVGTACAFAVGKFAWGPALAALFGAICIQIGTNFANDVFDFEKGADTAERLGPTRAVQAGLLSARAVRTGMIVAFGLAALAGAYLTSVAGWVVVGIGAASILSGIAYTGGPYPLGYHGLGDLFVLVFFGFVAVMGTVFVQAGYVPGFVLWAALAVGALATCVIVVNNLRDIEQDRRAGKRTLAVRLGANGTIAEYALLLGCAYGAPLALVLVDGLSPWVLLPCLTLPWAIWLARQVAQVRGRALNALLKRTAQLLLVHGGLLAAGLALGRQLP
jgi:1,4-dihydroxy-2-naphthoate octaprenyltransferase